MDALGARFGAKWRQHNPSAVTWLSRHKSTTDAVQAFLNFRRCEEKVATVEIGKLCG